MQLAESIKLPRAQARIVHMRPKIDERGVPQPYQWLDVDGAPLPIDWTIDPTTGVYAQPAGAVSVDTTSADIAGDEVVYNVITNGGRDFLHTQGYGTAPAANGLNYIALSNDTLTETAASTTLSTEITGNGLARAQGTVTHTAGTNTTTVQRTFTCATAPQAAQKAALFTASSAGTMNHALAFTQRSLQVGDTLQVTFTITLG